ncbi:MAG TPA: hypothetical protein VMU26_03270 [Candidatus Polarisedimenticolia bacterium]|nr:hypothetical protein [Candidatus Polarisedimenticolia bacterium]
MDRETPIAPADYVPRRLRLEAKQKMRRGNLARRVDKKAPLFAKRIVKKELESHPEYFGVRSRLHSSTKEIEPMKPKVRLTLLCLSLLTAAYAVTPEMSHQQTIISSAYAKLAYASKQRSVLLVAKDGLVPVKFRKLPQDEKSIDAMLAAAEVTITLKDFVVGNLSDILGKKVSDVISPPQEFLLRSFLQDWTFTEQGSKPQPCNGLELRWERDNNPPGPESDNLKFDDIYRMQWGVERPKTVWQSYAAYTVTITFQHRTEEYRAMFIFGHDENGNEVAEPVDPTTDNSALAEALHEPLFPAALVSTRLRSNPTAASWVAANQMSDPSCSVGKGDVCCDLNTLKCGPSRADVSAALSQRIEGEK